jgi:processive 1,2-diacylglycerol beta-glucosyltransferase
MPPRILVLSAAVGAGHLRAAEAVEAALRQVVPSAEVENHDVLKFTNAVFRRVYGQFYLDLVNRAPHLLGYIYDLTDQPSRSGRNRTDRLRLAVEKLNLRRFERLVTERPWDLIINTHFLPAELIARLTSDGKLTVPQVTVCTDFDTHRLWVNQPCRRYFCATDEGAQYLQHWGVPAGDIDVTGIPIHPAFSQPADRAACLRAHGLVGDRPVVLQLCGGFGVGPVESLVRGLLAIEHPLELVVVCGRNEELKGELQRLSAPPRHRVHLLGFTREIDQLMAAADLIVSKPGGLTTSETLARGLPMVIVNPIPGQESRNSDYLLENGAAIKVNHPALLPMKVTRLLDDPARLARMRDAARSLGHPRAAFDVVERSLKLIGVRATGPG